MTIAPRSEQTDLNQVTLVYRDTRGVEHTQPLADITESGTLIDPHTGDDLELSHALIHPAQ